MNSPKIQQPSSNKTIQALIFDFDGLILDTETPIFDSWQEMYRKHGGELSLELWAGIIGTISNEEDHFEWLEQQLGHQVDRETLSPQRRQREYELIQKQLPRPGVVQYLQDARRFGLKVGLASSSPCDWVVGHLTRLGLIDYFDCIRASDDVRQVKPDPELFQAVLRELELEANQAIVLEDSPIGVRAARRAGIFTVAVPNELTRLMDFSQTNLVIESLENLPLEELLRKVFQLTYRQPE